MWYLCNFVGRFLDHNCKSWMIKRLNKAKRGRDLQVCREKPALLHCRGCFNQPSPSACSPPTHTSAYHTATASIPTNTHR